MATAVLSITAKQKKKAAEKSKGDEKMDVDSEKKEETKMEVEPEKKDEKEKKPEPEPNFEMLSNPARVMKAQLKVISLEDGENTCFFCYLYFRLLLLASH